MFTKEQLLQDPFIGQMVFQFYLNNLKFRNGKTQHVLSPLYKDTKPSFIVFYCKKTKRWRFFDYGNNQGGDFFDFVAQMNGLEVKEDFTKVLVIINDIVRQMKGSYNEIAEFTKIIPVDVDQSEFELFEMEELDEAAKKCIEEHNWDYVLMKSIGVVFLKQFNAISSAGKKYTSYNAKGEVMLAFKGNGFAKIYRPYNKQYRFMYLGKKPSNYLFLFHDGRYLELLNKCLGEIDTSFCVITGGEKDAITLCCLGIMAFSLNSETAELSEEVVNALKKTFGPVYVFYDNDDTGRKRSQEIALKHGLINVALPDFNGKDVSDWVKLGLPTETIHGLFNQNTVIEKVEPLKLDLPPELPMLENEDTTNESSILKFNTPSFPDSVYGKISEPLRSTLSILDVGMQRNIYLLSALAVIGGCLTKVKGIYHNKEYYPNLFLFITANASAGKGDMDKALLLIKPLLKKFKDDYEVKLAEHKKLLKLFEKEPDAFEEKPLRPNPYRLIIPGNTSSAGFIRTFASNNGTGILFETEADTLSKIQGQDWGNSSDIYRVCFHHETISMLRSGTDDFISIENPKLSIVLSGTPNQLFRMISDVENGLFSRFFIFAFDLNPNWKSAFDTVDYTLFEKTFREAGEHLLRLFNYLDGLENEILFKYTPAQQKQFDDFFSNWSNKFYSLLGEHSMASIRRLGLIAFRISMILATLREFEKKGSLPSEVICSDLDFNLTFSLIDVMLQHTITIYNRMPEVKHPSVSKNVRKLEFFESLPKEFDTKGAIELGETMDIPKRTVENYLKSFLSNNLITKISHGRYSKVK